MVFRNLDSMAAGEEILFEGTLRNIHIVYGLPEMASFTTQHISLSFVALAKDVERSQRASLFSLFLSLQYFKGLYTEPVSSIHLTRGGLGVSSMFILISSMIPWTFRVLNASRRIFSNCRFHPVEKPPSGTTKPIQEIYLYKHNLSELSREID